MAARQASGLARCPSVACIRLAASTVSAWSQNQRPSPAEPPYLASSAGPYRKDAKLGSDPRRVPKSGFVPTPYTLADPAEKARIPGKLAAE